MANSKPQDNADTAMYKSDRHSISTGGAHTPFDPAADDPDPDPPDPDPCISRYGSVTAVASCFVLGMSSSFGWVGASAVSCSSFALLLVNDGVASSANQPPF